MGVFGGGVDGGSIGQCLEEDSQTQEVVRVGVFGGMGCRGRGYMGWGELLCQGGH